MPDSSKYYEYEQKVLTSILKLAIFSDKCIAHPMTFPFSMIASVCAQEEGRYIFHDFY